MAPPVRTLTISRPTEFRHLGGVDITSRTGTVRNFEFEPDEAPTHINIAASQPPRRSNTIAHSLSRPSLRLKTSISRLRGRSISNSPETLQRRELPSTLEDQQAVSNAARREPDEPFRHVPHVPQRTLQDVAIPSHELIVLEDPAFKPAPPKAQTNTSKPLLSLFPKEAPRPPLPKPPIDPSKSSRSRPLIEPPKLLHQPSSRVPPTRPVRADSGTAIDFGDIPVDQRPLGFREIMKIKNFEERMALYKHARNYWANTDHGLGEWIERAHPRTEAFVV